MKISRFPGCTNNAPRQGLGPGSQKLSAESGQTSRSGSTASCWGRAGGSQQPLGGWSRWLGRGRQQQRAGRALSSQHCSPELQPARPAAPAARTSVPIPGSHGSGFRGAGGESSAAAPTDLSGQRISPPHRNPPSDTRCKSGARSPQPPGRATCGLGEGKGEPRPGSCRRPEKAGKGIGAPRCSGKGRSCSGKGGSRSGKGGSDPGRAGTG